MGEKVTRPVAVWREYPMRLEPLVVETTATPGLYIAEHPGDEDGWVLIAECGKYLGNQFRWKTPADAQAAAVALGETHIRWTLPYTELAAGRPRLGTEIVTALKPLADRRYPFDTPDPGPDATHRPGEATAAQLVENDPAQ